MHLRTVSALRTAWSACLVLMCAGGLRADPAPIIPKTLPLSYVRDFVWDGSRSRLVSRDVETTLKAAYDRRQAVAERQDSDDRESSKRAWPLARQSERQVDWLVTGSNNNNHANLGCAPPKTVGK